MADPTKYTRNYSFTDFQQTNPQEPLPGQQIDDEFVEIQTVIGGAVDAIKDVRRSDGALKNGIVTVESLDATVAAGVGSGALAAQQAAEAAAADAETAVDAAEDILAETQALRDEAVAAAARLTATSTTSTAVGAGVKVFTTQADKLFVVGTWVLIVDASSTSNYMHGQVTAYSGTSLTVNVTNSGGSGTIANWVITISGTRGATGPQGPAGSGAGDLLASNNLSDLADAATARANLGLTIDADVQAYSAILAAIAAGPADFSVPDYFTFDGLTDQVTLSRDPGSENAIDVRFDGVSQDKRTYSLSGTTLTFNDMPADGIECEVVFLAGLALPVGTPGDGTVTTPKLADSAVTLVKIDPSIIVTEAEGIDSNDNDTTLPTSAAVKDYVDTEIAAIPAPASALELISTTVASNSATVEIELPTGYSSFVLIGKDIIPTSDDRALLMRVSDDGGSTFETGVSSYNAALNFIVDNGASVTALVGVFTSIGVAGKTTSYNSGIGNGASEGVSFEMRVIPGGAKSHVINWSGSFMDGSTQNFPFFGYGKCKTTTASLTDLQLFFSNNTVASGTFYLYAMKDT